MIDEPVDRVSGRQAAGFLVLDKPSGPTSRAIVNRVARLFPGVKVGHAGTLDPLASGVLVVCLGAATRLVELVQRLPKSYRARLRLGGRSDTLDAEGRIMLEPSPWIPTLPEVLQATGAFRGEIVQTPPEYSALKISGHRSHELARAGRAVAPAPRVVRIDRIEVLDYQWPGLTLAIECGSGTYIRSIARDLGEALGCGAYIENLVRDRIGDFTLGDSIDAESLTRNSIEIHLRPLEAALGALPRVVLAACALEAVAHGQRVQARDCGATDLPPGELALLDQAGNLVALARKSADGQWLEPTKVLG